MISVFLGPDDFSKKSLVQALAKQAKANLAFYNSDNFPQIDELLGQDLFSAKKIHVLVDGLNFLGEQDKLPQLIKSDNHIIVLQIKADKRLNNVKKLLSTKGVETKEFALPHGADLDKWLIKRAGELGGKLTSPVANVLAQRLGRDEAKEMKFGGKVVSVEEVFDLWQADNELRKIIALADGKDITSDMVEELVPETLEADTLDIVNAIADKDKPKVYKLIDRFLNDTTSADEKGKIIMLNALLSEQFRNVAAVQDFVSRRVSDAQILEQTAWKSGRLFIIKKIASRFAMKNVLDLLSKLELLDGELKSTQTPPRVLLDLITSQLWI